MNDTRLDVFLLGGLEIRHADQPIQLPRRKTRALLAYLAAHPTPVMRDRLCDLLWPDAEHTAARQALRATLHELRRAIGDHLMSDTQRVGLAPMMRVDARRLAAALNRPQPEIAELAAALHMYRGEFLAGLTVPDSEAFQAWLDGQREQYRALALQGFDVLAQLHLAQYHYDAGLEAVRQGLALDPLAEGLHRTAMQLHYRAGDRVAAIRRYEQLRALLDDELGVPPMPETSALYDAIITDTLPPVPQPAAAAAPAAPAPATATNEAPAVDLLPFVGRDRELSLIGHLATSHKTILLEGEPGIGKTRLAREYLRSIKNLVIELTAREIDQALPYQPVIEGLRGLTRTADWPELGQRLELSPIWRAEVARLLPELLLTADLPAATADEARLREGLSRFLAALAQLRPVALLLDDAQWADTATLGLVSYLARQNIPDLLIVITSHTLQPQTPAMPMLTLLEREKRLSRLVLRRLTERDATALAQRLSCLHAEQLAAWLMRHAEGTPLIMAELLQHARANGLLGADGTLRVDVEAGLIVPPTVYNLIALRLGRLSGEAQRMLDAAAVVGHEFDAALVVQVSGFGDDTAHTALTELRRAGLIRMAEDGQYAFDHTMTVEVVRREMGLPRHRQLHRRVAEALEQQYAADPAAPAGEIAWHFFHSQAPERAAPYALRAARRAEQLAAWAEAVAWYRQALPHVAPHDTDSVRMDLGQALLMSGQPAEAADIFRQVRQRAWDRTDYRIWGSATLALARSLIIRSAFGEIVGLMREVCTYGVGDAIVQAELTWGTVLSVQGADLPGAEAHLQRAAELASEQHLAILAQITFERGSVAAQQGDLPRAVELYRAALQAAEQGGDETFLYVVLAHNNLGYHLLLLDDPQAAEHADAGLLLAQERGLIEMQPYLFSTSGEIALAHGELDQAEALFQNGLLLAERLEMPERIAGLTANLGLVALQRGQIDTARRRLTSALHDAEQLGIQHMMAQIQIWLAPLLPPLDAAHILESARAIAQRGGRTRLLAAIDQVAAALSPLVETP